MHSIHPFTSDRYVVPESGGSSPEGAASVDVMDWRWRSHGEVFDELTGKTAWLSAVPESCVRASGVKRFLRETKILSDLRSDSFLLPYDYGVLDGWIYSVTDTPEAQSVESIISEATEIDQILKIAVEVVSQLETIHSVAMTHRNVKASTILHGQSGTFVAGLGAERFVSTKFLHADQLCDRTQYMSPEISGMLERDVSATTDLYSFGILLYRMLAGRTPFRGSSAGDTLFRHLATAVPVEAIRKDVPASLVNVVVRLLEKEPVRRYQSATSVRHDLSEIRKRIASGKNVDSFVIGQTEVRDTLSAPDFVGRRAEMRILTDQLNEVAKGQNRSIAISSLSGGGKTRLMMEFIRRATKRNAIVLRGRASDSAAQIPIKAMAEILDQVVSWAQNYQEYRYRLKECVAPFAAEISVISKSLAIELDLYQEPDDANSGPVEFGQTRIENAVIEVLTALSYGSQPVLLWVDDCQWLDSQSTAILKRISRQESSNVFLVTTLRSDVGKTLQRFIDTMSPDHHLSVGPLLPEEIRLLGQSMAGGLPDEILAMVVKFAHGSPFMAASILRGLVSSEAIVPKETGWETIPEKLAKIQAADDAATLLVQRLENLPSASRYLLSLMSVIGNDASLDAIEAIAGQADSETIDFLAALQYARQQNLIWLQSNGHYCFAHDKIRETLESKIPFRERQGLHLAFANYLRSSEPERVFDLAFHFDLGNSPEQAVKYAIESAKIAKQRFLQSAAEVQLRIAIKNLRSIESDKRLRYQLYSDLAESLMLSGKYEQAETWLEKSQREAETSFDKASVYLKIGEHKFRIGDKEEATKFFEQAFSELGHSLPGSIGHFFSLGKEAVIQAFHSRFPSWFVSRKDAQPDESTRLGLKILGRLGHGYWYTRQKSLTLWTHLRAMNWAEQFLATPELAQVYSEHAPAMSLIPWKQRGLAYAKKSLKLRNDWNDTWGQGQTRNFESILYYACGHFDETVLAASRAATILQRTGDYWEVNIARYHMAAGLLRQGKLKQAGDEARRIYEDALALGDFQSTGNILDVWARATLGQLPLEVLERESNRAIQDIQCHCQIQLARGVRFVYRKELDRAIECLAQALKDAKKADVVNAYVVPIYSWLATAVREKLEDEWPRNPVVRKSALKQVLRICKQAVRNSWRFVGEKPHAYRELGIAYALAGKNSKAKRAFNKSILFATEQGASYELAQTKLVFAQFNSDFNWQVASDSFANAKIDLDEILEPVRSNNDQHSVSLNERLESLLECGRNIIVATSNPEICHQTNEACQRLLRGQKSLLVETDPDNSTKPHPRFNDVPFDRRLFADALDSAEPIVATAANDAGELEPRETGSFLVCRIQAKGKLYGVLYVSNNLVEGLYGDEEKRIASYLATAAATAFEKTGSFHQLEHINANLEQLVEQRTKLIETRSIELEETASQLRETQVDLERAKDEAEHANEVKSDFLARMSHEIRTPISAILGFAELILNGVINEPAARQKKIKTIHASGQHLLGLVNDILDLSKIEADQLTMESIAFSPAELVHEVLETLRPSADVKSISLTFDVATPVPKTVESDPTRFRQVITNLVSNAIKFTKVGGVRVALSYGWAAGDPNSQNSRSGQLTLSVVDTGIGMCENKLDHIFDPFSQADTSTTREYGGTGLGLSISKRLVEAFGGGIKVSSRTNEGSEFEFWIPVQHDKDRLVSPEEIVLDDSLSTLAVRWQPVDLQGAKICIVDDAETNREFLDAVLVSCNAELTMCNNGQEAVDCVVADDSFDLVLMDMQMPVLDGHAATKIIREKGISVPIIALTANTMSCDEQQCFDAGCTAYLAKPIDVGALLNLIKPLVERSCSRLAVNNEKELANPLTESYIPLAIETDLSANSHSNFHSKFDSPKKKTNLSNHPQVKPAMMGGFEIDEQVIRTLGNKFRSKVEHRLPALKKAVENWDETELRRAGHWIKGSAGMVQLNGLADCGVRLETLARSRSFNEINQLLEDIEQLISD